MKCPNCGYEIYEPFDECEVKHIKSGKGYNATFGMTEYWFIVELTCPKCQHKFEYSDSSL